MTVGRRVSVILFFLQIDAVVVICVCVKVMVVDVQEREAAIYNNTWEYKQRGKRNWKSLTAELRR